MKYFILLIIFLYSFSFAQYLDGRLFLEVSGSYWEGEFKEVNKYIDTINDGWFDNKIKHFKMGIGPGVGIGYGISNQIVMVLRYSQMKFKNYNRDTMTGVISSHPVSVETNYNFKLTADPLTLNIISYLYNSPFLGLTFGIGGGILTQAKFNYHLYQTVKFTEDNSTAILADRNLTYQQKYATPVGNIFIGIDLSLGVLTSLLVEGGYRMAKVSEMKLTNQYGTSVSDGEPFKNSDGTKTEFDYSGIYANAVLRFLF